jgi:hypothetical protein
MKLRSTKLAITLIVLTACAALIFAPQSSADDKDRSAAGRGNSIDQMLSAKLRQLGFTGN